MDTSSVFSTILQITVIYSRSNHTSIIIQKLCRLNRIDATEQLIMDSYTILGHIIISLILLKNCLASSQPAVKMNYSAISSQLKTQHVLRSLHVVILYNKFLILESLDLDQTMQE